MKQIGDPIFDKRVDSYNYMFELSIREYYELSKNIIQQNEFQRKRVRSSKTIYSLLKADLLNGCLIPAIVLAFYDESPKDKNLADEIVNHSDRLVILDGLQRTFTIHELVKEVINNDGEESILNKALLRIEVYWGITRTNVLYRMLTLNTGHTQMSTRHQLEIVFSDLLSKKISGITVVKEVDNKRKTQGEYAFDDLIEGFTAYLEGECLPMDRSDLLNIVKDLDTKIQKNKQERDLFEKFIVTYDMFIKKIDEFSNKWSFDSEENELSNPFGNDVFSIFGKSISISGFGAAICKLMQSQQINTFDEIIAITDTMSKDTLSEGLNLFILNMEYIRNKASKIGNFQRYYTNQFFLCFFSTNQLTRGNFLESVKTGFSNVALQF